MVRSRSFLSGVTVFIASMLSGGAAAQQSLYVFEGDSNAGEFGRSVSGAGDVNNDGYGDLIAGAPNDNVNGAQSGSARVFSGSCE